MIQAANSSLVADAAVPAAPGQQLQALESKLIRSAQADGNLAVDAENILAWFEANRPQGAPPCPFRGERDPPNSDLQVFVGQLPEFVTETRLTRALEFLLKLPGAVRYSVMHQRHPGASRRVGPSWYAMVRVETEAAAAALRLLSRRVYFLPTGVTLLQPPLGELLPSQQQPSSPLQQQHTSSSSPQPSEGEEGGADGGGGGSNKTSPPMTSHEAPPPTAATTDLTAANAVPLPSPEAGPAGAPTRGRGGGGSNAPAAAAAAAAAAGDSTAGDGGPLRLQDSIGAVLAAVRPPALLAAFGLTRSTVVMGRAQRKFGAAEPAALPLAALPRRGSAADALPQPPAAGADATTSSSTPSMSLPAVVAATSSSASAAAAVPAVMGMSDGARPPPIHVAASSCHTNGNNHHHNTNGAVSAAMLLAAAMAAAPSMTAAAASSPFPPPTASAPPAEAVNSGGQHHLGQPPLPQPHLLVPQPAYYPQQQPHLYQYHQHHHHQPLFFQHLPHHPALYQQQYSYPPQHHPLAHYHHQHVAPSPWGPPPGFPAAVPAMAPPSVSLMPQAAYAAPFYHHHQHLQPFPAAFAQPPPTAATLLNPGASPHYPGATPLPLPLPAGRLLSAEEDAYQQQCAAARYQRQW